MKAEINGIHINYRDEGEGEPVVFIHAFPLSQKIWDDQVTAVKDRCRAITLDLRGFGDSDAPDGVYEMSQMAEDVRELMRKLSIDSATIVGISMGSYVSLAFYRAYPEAVRALILVDTRATADNEEGRHRREKSAEKAEREGSGAIADDMIPLFFTSATIAERQDLIDRTRSIIEANSPRAIAAAQRGMAARFDSNDLLSRIDFPVLVITGSEDKLTPVSESEAMRDAIAGAEFRIIEGASHLSNLERPDEFNAALIDFLDRRVFKA